MTISERCRSEESRKEKRRNEALFPGLIPPPYTGRKRRDAIHISANLFWMFFVKTPTKTSS
jgi:hypothetical protein